jgi:MoxR-like ATPase
VSVKQRLLKHCLNFSRLKRLASSSQTIFCPPIFSAVRFTMRIARVLSFTAVRSSLPSFSLMNSIAQRQRLRAMEERRVTVDGTTYELPLPFFMIATQNPRQQIGTYPLPESQLDRFLMRISLGYPSREAEKQLLIGESRLSLVDELKPVALPADLLQMQNAARSVHVSENIISYIQDIIEKTRTGAMKNSSPVASKFLMQGLSPRGALGFVSAARSWAFMQGRSMILPEDVQAVAIPVMSHRLNPVDDLSGDTGARWAEDILASVRVE